MRDRNVFLLVAVGLCLMLLATAFLAAPYSCRGGLSAYVWSGAIVCVALMALPWALRRPGGKRWLLSIALAATGLACWVVGLFVSDLRIVCRLF